MKKTYHYSNGNKIYEFLTRDDKNFCLHHWNRDGSRSHSYSSMMNYSFNGVHVIYSYHHFFNIEQ